MRGSHDFDINDLKFVIYSGLKISGRKFSTWTGWQQLN